MSRDRDNLGENAANEAGGLQASPPEPPAGIYVRATVHLPGLGRGDHAYVNPLDPEVAKALRATWIVPLDGENPGGLADLGGPAFPADIHDS